MSLEFNIDSIGYTPEKGGSGSITPSGTKSISENGVYDVTYFAKASVNVEGTVPTGTTTITANGTYDVTAYANASVNVEGSEPTLVTKTITENGTYAASSDNADGYSSVSVNVSSTEPTLTDLTVTPSTTSQTITPVSDGYGTVTVEAVTASIDADIQASNIKSGVNILGVQGNVTELAGTTTTITTNGTYVPTGGANGFTSVSVNVAGTTPTGTYTITSNGTYDVTDYATADVNVSGGGTSTKRGSWLVPSEYTALDAETMSIYNTYSPANAVGIYIDRDLLGSNRYLFLPQSGVTYKAYTKNGEKTISVASDVDSFVSEIPLSSGENWLVITASDNGGTVDTHQIPYSASSTIAPYLMGQYNAVKYACVMSNNALGGFPQMGCYRNLEEYHPLATGVIKLAGIDLASFADSRSLKYISSASEYSYDSSLSSWGDIIINGNTLQRLGYLPNLPYGADFSTATTYDWNFSTNTSQVGGAYLRGGAILRSMYITIPKVNITMNGTPSSITNTGVNLTADNWDYITEHAPTGSGKTITINAYNNTQMGATNKAALQAKGWTITVI